MHALGGEQVSEQSLASRTGWLDLARRDWWDEALAWSGARRSLLPELVASGEPVGTAHDRWDIPGLGGAALTVAGHDHQAAAIGADAARAARRAGLLRHGRGLRAHGAARAARRRHPRPHRRGDHRRLARPARALVPARRDPRRPRPAARPGPARAGPSRPPGARRRRPARRTRRAGGHRRRRVPGRPARRSATTSTPPGSGGPPSPPRSTPVGTSTTPCPAPAAPTRTSS